MSKCAVSISRILSLQLSHVKMMGPATPDGACSLSLKSHFGQCQLTLSLSNSPSEQSDNSTAKLCLLLCLFYRIYMHLVAVLSEIFSL